MEKRSLVAYSKYSDGSQKFDYFVAGISGALFAYLAPTYTPKKFELSAHSLEPFALVFLALSFYFGMKRIESVVQVMRENHCMLDGQEKAGHLTGVISRGESSGFNELSGEIIEASELPARRDFYIQQAREAGISADAAAEEAASHNKKRNFFLYAGFLAILASKLLLPYT